MPYADHQRDAQSIVARCAIITLSDTRTPATDTSGLAIRNALQASGHTAVETHVLPDEPATLRQAMSELLSRDDLDAVLANGGTGVGRRDQTIDVIAKLLDVPLPGFGELFRMLSWQQVGSGAMLSRAVGGIARGKAVFAMPGSTQAVELAMSKLILPELRHLLHELRK